MEKKKYIKPKSVKFAISVKTSLLTGSPFDEIGEGTGNGGLETKYLIDDWEEDEEF